MTSPYEMIELFFLSYESLIVLIMTAITCSTIGSFLILRKLSMVSDAISHTVLLGIVIAFFITKDVSSPFLIVGATIFGVITVYLIQSLSDTGLVKNDDAVGIIFPLLFSIAVILITKFARNAHIDTDIVLMGEVILAPINRVDFFGISLPKALVNITIVFLINISFISIFFKELKLNTFDKDYASVIGISSSFLFYSLMTLTSLTAVVSFDAVGAILVISFLITPSASAYLITKELKKMLLISCIYSIVNSILGYTISILLNLSISGTTAFVAGITFFITLLLNKEGIITSAIIRLKNKKELKLDLLTLHIGNHMEDINIKDELGISTIHKHLIWKKDDIKKYAQKLIQKGIIKIDLDNNIYLLTEIGIKKYKDIKQAYNL